MDAGEFPAAHRPQALDLLTRFDQIFDVLEPRSEGRLSQEEIEQAIASRQAAKKGPDFARADAIRQELVAKGVILEDTKEGTRWKYATATTTTEPRP